MNPLPDLSQLREEHEQIRASFLETDLALCLTFTELAHTERQIGDREAARRALATAEEGYATISRFAQALDNAEHQEAIGRKLSDLRKALDLVRYELKS